ncbi:MAG: undecaprenyl-phosphate galactose phosphotransferase WbaP [Alphaproteobacteria bacterium]|nr:undecaprenyl-phosphate galactose phosphotransferase WbaP [Alphaproteobacteria bacterium]
MTPREALARKFPLIKLSNMAANPLVGSRPDAERQLAGLLSGIESVDVEGNNNAEPAVRRGVTKALRWFIAVDATALSFGFICAWVVAASINSIFYGRSVPSLFSSEEGARLIKFMAIAVGTMLWFEHTGHYRIRMPFWLEVQKVVNALIFAMMIDGFMQFVAKQDISRLWLMSSWGFAGIVILIGRNFARRIMRRSGVWQVRTILVGTGDMADEAQAALLSEPGLGYKICKRIENLQGALAKAGGLWSNLCSKYNADYVVIALDSKELSDADSSIAQLMREDVPFSVSPPFRQLPVLGMTPQYFFNHDVMLMTRNSKLEQPLPRFMKRSFDVLASGAALVALCPIMIAVAIAVKLDGGAAMFGHKRLGMNGKTFNCLKFRSMIVNSDSFLQKYLGENLEARAEWNKDQKLRNDPRVTKIGAILRRTSIDELPQLINVLKGDMSLVGPRPIIIAETDKYYSDIAHYYRVRPGITGLWQVSGRNDVTYARRVQMDSWYVRNWSLWHDIAIICKTFPVLLNRSGAY